MSNPPRKSGQGEPRKKIGRCFETKVIQPVYRGQKAKTVIVHYYIEQLENGRVALELVADNGDPTGEFAAENIYLNDFKERYKSCSEHDCPLTPRTVEEIKRKMAEKRVEMGEKHLENKEYDEAEDKFKRSLNLDEDNIKAQIGLGKAKMEKNLIEEALKIFRSIREANKIYEQANKHTFNEFAIYLRKKNLFDEAVENYEKAIIIDPFDEILYYNLGRAYWEMGEPQNAIEKVKEGLKIASDKKMQFLEGMSAVEASQIHDEDKAHLLKTYDIAKSALDFYLKHEKEILERYFQQQIGETKKAISEAASKLVEELYAVAERLDFGGDEEARITAFGQIGNIKDELAELVPDKERMGKWIGKLEIAVSRAQMDDNIEKAIRTIIAKVKEQIFKGKTVLEAAVEQSSAAPSSKPSQKIAPPPSTKAARPAAKDYAASVAGRDEGSRDFNIGEELGVSMIEAPDGRIMPMPKGSVGQLSNDDISMEMEM